MRKAVVFIVIAVLFVTIFFYFKYVFGRMEFRWNKDTPDKFLSHVVVDRRRYVKDRTEILNQFRGDMRKHVAFFYSKEFDDSTQIIIDTILYNPDFNKVAVFVLTKNPTSKQLAPNNNSDWYYDATCYLGARQRDTINLSWIGPAYTNSTNKAHLINTVREYYFRLIATEKDAKGHNKYNLNDIRFWNEAIWKEVEGKKQREKEFQELKKKHPEDVYEPKS